MCLMYVMNFIRLDIAYSVNKHSRFTSNLSMSHWKAIKKVLKYLRYILDYVLHYIGYPIVLKDIVMLIEYLTQKIQNPQVDMSLHFVEHLCYGSPSNKHVSLDSRWNQSLLLLIKLEMKPNGFKIS